MDESINRVGLYPISSQKAILSRIGNRHQRTQRIIISKDGWVLWVQEIDISVSTVHVEGRVDWTENIIHPSAVFESIRAY